jgi:hypothetical protein
MESERVKDAANLIPKERYLSGLFSGVARTFNLTPTRALFPSSRNSP